MCWTLNRITGKGSGFGVQDSGCGTQATGYGERGAGLNIQNRGEKTEDNDDVWMNYGRCGIPLNDATFD